MRYIAGAFILVVCFLGQSCESSLCDYQDKIEFPSPDGKTIAAVYEYDCGATTPFAVRVNLRPHWYWFNPRSDVVFLVKNLPKVRVVWKNNSEIEVECKDCVQRNVFRADPRWKNVSIRYRQ